MGTDTTSNLVSGCKRVAVGDTIVDGRREGLVTLVSRDMPGIVAVDFGDHLSIVSLDAVLVRNVRGPQEFIEALAAERGWDLGRAGVVARQMLVDAGLSPHASMTGLAWLDLAAAYWAADVHAAAWHEAVAA